MPEANDMELVRQFAAHRSDAAFTELVQRHINLVYSVALRCTRNPGDAQDVAQTVFITLARKASGLSSKTILTGWLYETTRFTALNFLTGQTRRQIREQKASMQPNPNDANVWELLAPHLEEAMGQLATRDRTLLALRFYENKTGVEAAALLGIKEDAAYKRTNRALEKLRSIFAKRGVALTATAIASAVAANAVKAAPTGLAATIAAGTLATTSITTTAITMTLLQKIAVTAAIAISASAGIYEAKQAADARTQLQQQGALTAQMQQLQQERDDATNRLARLQDENAKLSHDGVELLALRNQVGQLQKKVTDLKKARAQDAIARTPQATTSNPGMSDLSPREQQQVTAMRKMDYAKQGVLGIILFAEANQQQYPTNFDQLATYVTDTNSLADLTANYEFTYQGMANGITNPGSIIVLREKQPWQTVDGAWVKVYGFADGHAELHNAGEGNFDEWENQHLMLPATGP